MTFKYCFVFVLRKLPILIMCYPHTGRRRKSEWVSLPPLMGLPFLVDCLRVAMVMLRGQWI